MVRCPLGMVLVRHGFGVSEGGVEGVGVGTPGRRRGQRFGPSRMGQRFSHGDFCRAIRSAPVMSPAHRIRRRFRNLRPVSRMRPARRIRAAGADRRVVGILPRMGVIRFVHVRRRMRHRLRPHRGVLRNGLRSIGNRRRPAGQVLGNMGIMRRARTGLRRLGKRWPVREGRVGGRIRAG